MTKKEQHPGGVKLTAKTARTLAMQEFGTARGLTKSTSFVGVYFMEFGNLRIEICADTACITITAEQIERVNLILSGVPGGIEKALSSTIRRANNTVRSETLKGITTVYAITRQNVRAETTIKVCTQSSDGGIVGTVLFAGHKIPLYRFNVSPTIPIQRATVSAAVLAGNGRTPFQDAFIARMQSGHTGMFERDGSKRLPISEFMGPSTAQMAGNSIVLADVEEMPRFLYRPNDGKDHRIHLHPAKRG